MISRIKNKILSFTIILGLFLIHMPTVYAVDNLINPKDMLSNSDLGAFSEHSISFGLPEDSNAIVLGDYIVIDLPYFKDVSRPSYIHGDYSGNPIYNVMNNRISITNIRVSPGSFITISGITAYNPTNPELFDVNLNITANASGSVIHNSAAIIATQTENSVVVYASVDPAVGILRISGLSAPKMFITFSENGTVIGTTVADNNGSFTQAFAGINPVVHHIDVFGSDAYNRTTPPSYVEVFTRPYELTEVTGIVLAPTVSLNKTQLLRGESIAIMGTGVPNYKTIIFTEPPLNSMEVVNDENGNYSYTITDTADMEFGDHRVYALVQDGIGAQSRMSLNYFFKVIDETTPPDPGEEPNFDVSKGDLSGDGKVNLTDFSILLFYWGTNSAAGDVNADHIVNLIDFSIMMFYWEG